MYKKQLVLLKIYNIRKQEHGIKKLDSHINVHNTELAL